jgi:hypothetical protein
MHRNLTPYGIPGADIIKIIYDGTASNSPGRRFLVDAWALAMNECYTVKETHDAVFVRDLVNVLLQQKILLGDLTPEEVSETWLKHE